MPKVRNVASSPVNGVSVGKNSFGNTSADTVPNSAKSNHTKVLPTTVPTSAVRSAERDTGAGGSLPSPEMETLDMGLPLSRQGGTSRWGMLGNPGRDLGTGGEPELGQDVLDVGFGSALGDDEPAGDLLVGQALGDEFGDPPFAPGQRRRRAGLGGGLGRPGTAGAGRRRPPPPRPRRRGAPRRGAAAGGAPARPPRRPRRPGRRRPP